MERATRAGGTDASLDARTGGKLDLAPPEESRGIVAVGEGGAEGADAHRRGMLKVLWYVSGTGTLTTG